MAPDDPSVVIRDAVEADLTAINALYNDEILHGTATWEEAPWTAERRASWLAELRGDPANAVLVADDEVGSFLGFAYLSPYRPRSGYRFTRESTLYVVAEARRRGVGRALLGALVEHARAANVHALLAVIEAQNVASITLHAALGFREVGRQLETGFKFGRWLDAVTMELLVSRSR